MIGARWTWLRRFARGERGATAVEFALLVGLFLSLMLGVIDAGRLAWTINTDKAATRAGARLAAVSPIVAIWLQSNFACFVNGNGQGAPVTGVPVMICSASGCSASNTPPNCMNSPSTAADSATFNVIVSRMQQFDSSIQPTNVEIQYDHVGLGVIGDPAGCDINPLVTVRLKNKDFQAGSLQLFGLANFTLPSMTSSLTSEHQIQSSPLQLQSAGLPTRCPSS